MPFVALLSPLFNILKNPKILLGIAILVIVTVGYLHYAGLKSQIADLTTQVTELTTEKALLAAANDHCIAVNIENKKVFDRLDALSIDTQKRFDDLNVSVTKQGSKTASKVREILDRPAPQTCEGAIELLIDAAKGVNP